MVARGGALGIIAAELIAALAARGIDVRPWCASHIPVSSHRTKEAP